VTEIVYPNCNSKHSIMVRVYFTRSPMPLFVIFSKIGSCCFVQH
jgi:hypothetical protein